MVLTVRASAALRSNDTITLRYDVSSDVSSQQPLRFFAVVAGASVSAVRGPVGWHASFGVIEDSAVIDWSSLARRADVVAGHSLAGFTYEGRGELSIVGYSAQARYALPVVEESTASRLASPPSLWVNAARGLTIGIVPLPPDVSPLGRLTRLTGLLVRACQLGWVAGSGVCNSLMAKLRAATSALQRGDTQPARGTIDAFLNEVAALGDEHATTQGRDLLAVSAQALAAAIARSP